MTTPIESKCCEKCDGRIEDENGFGRYYGCLTDEECTCHDTTPQRDWEERFDQEFPEFGLPSVSLSRAMQFQQYTGAPMIKAFIAQEIEAAKKERDAFWEAQEMGKSSDCWKHEQEAYARGFAQGRFDTEADSLIAGEATTISLKQVRDEAYARGKQDEKERVLACGSAHEVVRGFQAYGFTDEEKERAIFDDGFRGGRAMLLIDVMSKRDPRKAALQATSPKERA